MGCPYCSRCKEYFKDKKDFKFHMKWHGLIDKFGYNMVKVGYNTYYVLWERHKVKPGARIEMWKEDTVNYIELTDEILDEIIRNAYLPSISEAMEMYEKVFRRSIIYGRTNFSNYLGKIIETNIEKMIDEKMKKE